MAYALFFIPSVLPEDGGVVWQLEMIADAHGFEVRKARRTGHTHLSTPDSVRITDSDAAIVLATKPLDEHARRELAHASASRRPVLALVASGAGVILPPGIDGFEFTRGASMDAVSHRLMTYVTQRLKKEPSVGTAVAWLLGIGLGLFVLDKMATPMPEPAPPRRRPKKRAA